MAARIEHVVVLMLENRSFDHIFGFRSGVEGLKGTEVNLLDPSLPESASNPAFHVTGGASNATESGQGPGHSIAAANWQLCNNKKGPSAAFPARNNGFVKNYRAELIDECVGPGAGKQLIETGCVQEYRLTIAKAKIAERVGVTHCFFELVDLHVVSTEEAETLRKTCSLCILQETEVLPWRD
jgi:hypothetical protein